MSFEDRDEAGHQLAERLVSYRGPDTVVVALPRGGLPVARPIAQHLGAPLDVLVARKIGAPGQEEFALGAITARGVRVMNEQALRGAMLPPGYLGRKTEEQRALAARREEYLRGARPPVPLKGKQVILVDDGIATGMTVRAAIADVRSQAPRFLVVAAPVIAPDTARELAKLVDAVVALLIPPFFYAVGQFYEHFPQVSDEEAREALLAPQP